MAHDMNQSTERLTGAAADDAVESPSGGVEAFHVTAPEQVGTTNDAEALILESLVEDADTWEQ
jgi:hypothetical protein